MGLILDELDLKILRKSYFLKEGETQKIWKWTLEFFPEDTEDHQRTSKYNKIMYRLRHKLKNLYIVDKNGCTYFLLDREKVKFQKKKLGGVMKDCLIIILEV